MNLLDQLALFILLLVIIVLILILSSNCDSKSINISGGGCGCDESSGGGDNVIRPIKFRDLNQLLMIVKDKSVMSNIGQGKIWSKEKLTNYIKTGEQDWKENKNPREYVAFTIVDEEDTPIGIVQWKLVDDQYMARIFLARDRQGKGVGTKALKQSIKYIQDHGLKHRSFIAEVHEHNQASEKALLKVGFKYKKMGQIGKHKVKIFEYDG